MTNFFQAQLKEMKTFIYRAPILRKKRQKSPKPSKVKFYTLEEIQTYLKEKEERNENYCY